MLSFALILLLFLFLSVWLNLTCSHFFVSPPHSLCLSRSLFLSLCFSAWREHQRDQAGLAYWKQMADQRQEGHSFMKRGLNMPGPCRGACPWMMATWCVWVCACVWVSIWEGDGWFCRLPIWGMGPPNHRLSLSFFSVIICASQCTGWGDFWRTMHQWIFSELVALKPLTPGALLHYNQESKAGAWDPSSLAKWSCVQ